MHTAAITAMCRTTAILSLTVWFVRTGRLHRASGIQKVIEPVRMTMGSHGVLHIMNRYDFILLDHLQAHYRVLSDGACPQRALELPASKQAQVQSLASRRFWSRRQ